MITLIVSVLKKLAAICWRVLTNDPCHAFRRSAVAPVSAMGRTAGKRKVRIRELGNNGHSVLDTLILEGEKPPPCTRAAS